MRAGLAAEQLAEAEGTTIRRDDEREAAAAFRYERRLLAAEEMDSWLRGWELSVGDWMAWVRRSLLRQRYENTSDTAAAVDESDVAGLSFTTAVLSGDLERFARSLAVELVVPEPPAPTRAEVDREIERRLLDWTRVDYEWLAFPRESMAREAVLWVGEDGRPLEDVADVAGVTVTRERIDVEGVSDALRSVVLAADPGDVHGPVPVDGSFVVLRVRSRQLPSADDDAVVGQAQSAIIDRVIQSQLDERVRWA